MIEGRARDLAMFNLAIDSKLRGCDVVALKVEDVAPNGYTVERATVWQRKTRRPVKFELTEQTRQAVEDYLRASGKKPGEFLFSGRRQGGHCMTTRQYARLVAEWIGAIGLDPRLFGTHSLRRTKATLIYRRTGNLRAVQLLLGHTKIDYVPCRTMSRRAVIGVHHERKRPACRDIVDIVKGFSGRRGACRPVETAQALR
jgi:integrase